MKTKFFRNKRSDNYSISPLHIKVEKRTRGDFSGVLQSIINIVVYLLVFFLFFKDRMQYMGLFIALMAATTIAQVLIRVGKRLKRTDTFPYFEYNSGKKKYSAYLEGISAEIEAYITRYSSIMRDNYVSAQELYAIINTHNNKLWQRLPKHEDFLCLNIGTAFYPLPIVITYPQLTYDENESLLESFRQEFDVKVQNSSYIRLPIAYDLRNQRTISLVRGNVSEDSFCSILNAIIIDVATMHAPEELAICTLYSPELPLDWTRFLPHVWCNNSRLLYCGSDKKEDFMANVRTTLNSPQKYCIAFVDADYIANCADSDIYTYFNSDILPQNLCVVFFSFDGRSPSRVAAKIEYSYQSGQVVGVQERQKETQLIFPNIADEAMCSKMAKALYNIKLIDNRKPTTSSLPREITFFDLFEVQNPSSLPVASGYPDLKNNLNVKVGKTLGGKDETIHICNDGDGNHIYISGTTGSGKTEFIRTYLLAACSKFSPEYFNFIVIDFKDGSLSKSINLLAHCAGEFTNSEGSVSNRQVARIATMLRSEYNYRARMCINAGCGDIYDYQKKYYDKKVSEPLPLLLIVVDEVAVFFADNSKAKNIIDLIATTGRQYGMHLMLATQAKSGVVTGQIKTNINIRVDFYSSDDSNSDEEKIKGRATISTLKSTRTSQIAWSSKAPASARTVDFLRMSGMPRDLKSSSDTYQLAWIIGEINRRFPSAVYEEYVRDVLKTPMEALLKDKPISLSEIQDMYYGYLGKKQNGPLFPIGLVDDIYDRKRGCFTISPKMGNIVVYGRAKTGKTTLVKTMLLSIFDKEYGLSPDDIVVHILTDNIKEYNGFDFPQIGSILSIEYTYYALLYIENEISRRKSLASPSTAIPIVVIFDGCFFEISKNAALQKMFEALSMNCEKYNISIIVTLTHKAGMIANGALKHFNNHIAFYMGEDFDYSSLGMHLDQIKKIPNVDGLCLVDIPIQDCSEGTLETQIALPPNTSTIQEHVQNWHYLWAGKAPAQSIPTMPAAVHSQIDGNRILTGIGTDLRKAYWDLSYAHSYLISYFYAEDKNTVLVGITAAAANSGFDVIIVDNSNHNMKMFRSSVNVRYFESESDEIEQVLASIIDNPSDRNILFVMNDFAKTIYPGGYKNERKELARMIMELLRSSRHNFCGVFADDKDSINSGRAGSQMLISFLEGIGSGLLIGNTPHSHTFGYNGLPYMEQDEPIPVGWAVHVQSSSTRIKLISEVKQ